MMANDEDRPQFVGIDFGAMAAQLLGITEDPVTLGMQCAASAATRNLPAARRLAVARSMMEYFREMEAEAQPAPAPGGEPAPAPGGEAAP